MVEKLEYAVVKRGGRQEEGASEFQRSALFYHTSVWMMLVVSSKYKQKHISEK